MIALAAVMASALMAFVGISSASAATLCSNSGTGVACASGKAYTGPIAAELKPGTTVNITGALPMTCRNSTLSGQVTAGGPGSALNSMTLSGCTMLGATCSFKSVNMPYKMTASGAGGNGNVNVSSGESGNPGYIYTCLGVTCELQSGSAGANLAFEGSATGPALKAKSVPLIVTSGSTASCGQTAILNAEYKVTTPTSLWIF